MVCADKCTTLIKTRVNFFQYFIPTLILSFLSGSLIVSKVFLSNFSLPFPPSLRYLSKPPSLSLSFIYYHSPSFPTLLPTFISSPPHHRERRAHKAGVYPMNEPAAHFCIPPFVSCASVSQNIYLFYSVLKSSFVLPFFMGLFWAFYGGKPLTWNVKGLYMKETPGNQCATKDGRRRERYTKNDEF